MVEKATLDLAADMLDAARARIAELGDERDRWEEVVKRHVARIAELEHALACISKAPSQSMARRIACQAETEEKP
jgi:coenzyme F420-reducing hydrogenase alpha subunit